MSAPVPEVPKLLCETAAVIAGGLAAGMVHASGDERELIAAVAVDIAGLIAAHAFVLPPAAYEPERVALAGRIAELQDRVAEAYERARRDA